MNSNILQEKDERLLLSGLEENEIFNNVTLERIEQSEIRLTVHLRLQLCLVEIQQALLHLYDHFLGTEQRKVLKKRR